MVGDNAQGYVALFALAVMCAGYVRDLMGDIHDSIDIKQRVYALTYDGKTLKTHAGVDILL